jgi:Co/Zn/Cd efflux system component
MTCGWLTCEAITRLLSPPEVEGGLVLVVARSAWW